MKVDRKVDRTSKIGERTPDELSAAADDAYLRVVSDPVRYSGLTAELLARAREARQPEAVVAALRARAWALHAVLDNAGALRLLDEAAAVARRHRLSRRLAEILVVRAVTHQELGASTRARRDLARAQAHAEGPVRAQALLQLATLDHNAGRVRDAAVAYRRVLAEPGCPPDVWVKAANNLAVAETQLGRPATGLEVLDKAAPVANEMGPNVAANVQSNRAWSMFHAGRVVEGLRLFESSGTLFEAAGLPLGEHYLYYADVLVDLRLLSEAERVSRLAMADFEAHGARLMAAEAQVRLARLALALDDPRTALRDAESAVAELSRQRRWSWAARARVVAVRAALDAGQARPVDLQRAVRAAVRLAHSGDRGAAVDAYLVAGRVALQLGRRRAGLGHLAAAQSLSRGQPLLVRLRGRVAAALAAQTRGDTRTVLQECRRGLADLADHRAVLPSLELRALVAGHGVEFGRIGLRAMLPGTTPGAVLAWTERTRAVALLTLDPPSALGPEAEQDVSELHAAENALRAARRERGREPEDLVARIAVLEGRIRRAAWARGGAPGPTGRAASPGSAAEALPVTVSRLRPVLGDAWLLELAPVDGRLWAVVVGPRRTRLVDLGELAAVLGEVDHLWFAVRRLLRGGRFLDVAFTDARTALAGLTRLLLAPTGIPEQAELVVVPGLGTGRIPWAALRPGATTVAPSAALWARARSADSGDGGGGPAARVLVAGPDLPGALDEVSELAALYPQAQVLTPPHSTVADVMAAMRGADLAHLACHGNLRVDSPLFSALELSDGPLTLFELFERGVAPRRVVLAACHAGHEFQQEGDEVVGFASALLARGTRGVVASQVPLPDGASVPVMRRLHVGLARGLAVHEALRDARAEADRDSPEGFVAWCALGAYGAG